LQQDCTQHSESKQVRLLVMTRCCILDLPTRIRQSDNACYCND
jgi:hypothetical protein